MRYLTLCSLLQLLIGTCSAQCTGLLKSHGRLQWSEPSKIISPSRSWVVEVHPVLDADENRSPVTIRSCGEPTPSPLFTLQRSAEVYWSPDSKQVLVVNQPLSGTNKLLLFSTPTLSVEPTEFGSDALNKTVNEALTERLGKTKHIQFYLPTLVSWKENDILLAVGGQTSVAGSGPLDTYCYGLRINSNTLQVESVLSKKELKTNTGHGCQVSP